MYETVKEINPILYGSLKAALIQSTKFLSMTLAPQGIRVNSVSYGGLHQKKFKIRSQTLSKD